MALGHGPTVVTNGLVLALDAADRNSYPGSGTTWTDLSGRGNTGTLTNGPTFNSSNGGSIVFDGVDDYVQVNSSNSLQITDAVTVTSIVKVTGFGVNRARLIDTGATTLPYETGSSIALKIGTTSPFQDISWFISDGSSYYEVRKTNSIITSTSIPYIITSRWRKSDGAASIFVNGTEASYASTVNFTGTVGTLSNPLMIGFSRGYNIYGNQIIYTTHIYNRYLSDAEVQQNFNALRGRFGI